MLLFQFILIQTVIFGMVIFFLRKIMLGSTESAVNRLNESYSEINARKEKLSKLIEEAEKEYEQKKQEAKRIARTMHEDAQQEVDEKRSRLLHKAHEEAEKILSDTMSAKDRIREDIRREEKMLAVDRSKVLLKEALGGLFEERIDELLIENFIEEFKGMDKANIPPSVEEVVLVTRAELSKDLLETITDSIEQRSGRKLKFNQEVDPQVVGGLVIKFGSLTLDGSVAGKLEEASIKEKKRIEHNG